MPYSTFPGDHPNETIPNNTELPLPINEGDFLVVNGATWVSGGLPNYLARLNSTNGFGVDQTPDTAGTKSLGTGLLPWANLYIGAAATNNIKITGTATAARIFTLPDANSNAVRPSTAGSHQFMTGIASTGIISYAQPAASDISGVLSASQLPTIPSMLFFCSVGTLASAVTRYLYPGSAVAAVGEIKFSVPFNCTVQNLYIRSQTAPGAAITDSYTVRKNGVDTTLTASISGAVQTSNSDVTHTVAFSAGDDLSIKQVGGLLTGSSDVVISIQLVP